jgi:hypothetical protein
MLCVFDAASSTRQRGIVLLYAHAEGLAKVGKTGHEFVDAEWLAGPLPSLELAYGQFELRGSVELREPGRKLFQ